MGRKREKSNKQRKIRKTGKRIHLKGWRNEECNFNMLHFGGLEKKPAMASEAKMWDWRSGLEMPT